VQVLALGENRGFTGACLAGYGVAQGEFVLLLNNDTAVAPTWLAEIRAAFARHPQAGAIVGKIMLFDQPDHFHTAGDILYADGRPANRGVWQKDEGQYDQEEQVFSGCGAAVAYRRTALAEVGFLDDRFFFSCEDVDLGWRLNLLGWATWYVPTAVVYHKLKASGGSGATASYYDGRNRLYLLWKNYPTSLWRQNWRLILRAQWRISREALAAWRGEAARATLRGQLAGLFGYFRFRTSRRHIQTTRRLPDATLTALLTPVDAP
jgi:GT2 family glycosyltransferase